MGLSTPYYLFYADEFINNYLDLLSAFRNKYLNYQIAYSFKTNYTPAVCKIVLDLGGYAEVVSDMEFKLAKKVGFPIDRIIYNGPGKENYMNECILGGGLFNIDNFREAEHVCSLAQTGKYLDISVGIRVNFDIENGLHSRFGIDVCNGDLEVILNKLKKYSIKIRGLHFHISRARDTESWQKRIDNLLKIADKIEYMQQENLEYIDIGSGMFGTLDECLKVQFQHVPSYQDYAEIVAGTMNEHYKRRTKKPILFTEPGTTLISKYFSLFSAVLDIKTIRNKNFALLDCSFQNIGELCTLKKIPVNIVYHAGNAVHYNAIDLVGYTCLEQDVIYSDYTGELGVGDIAEFGNVGGYSIVSKPPFIHPDIPIYMNQSGNVTCVKRAQTMEDIFAPYVFENCGYCQEKQN